MPGSLSGMRIQLLLSVEGQLMHANMPGSQSGMCGLSLHPVCGNYRAHRDIRKTHSRVLVYGPMLGDPRPTSNLVAVSGTLWSSGGVSHFILHDYAWGYKACPFWPH